MKRIVGMILAGGLFALGAAAPAAWAQDKEPAKKEDHHRHGKRGMGLTDEQKGKLKAAFRAHRDAVTPLRDKLEDELDTLRKQVAEKKDDAVLQATLDRVEQDREAIRAEGQKFHKQLAGIIPAHDRALMALRMAERKMHRGGSMMFGGRPGMGEHPGMMGACPGMMGPRPGMFGQHRDGPDQKEGPGSGMRWRGGPQHEEKAGMPDEDEDEGSQD